MWSALTTERLRPEHLLQALHECRISARTPCALVQVLFHHRATARMEVETDELVCLPSDASRRR